MTITSFVIVASIAVSNAATITQSFSSNWIVDPYEYENQTSAWKWHYLPYQIWDASLGELTSVTIDTEFSGKKKDQDDDLRVRISFFTGWNPADYQFSTTEWETDDSNEFTFSNSWLFTDGLGLDNWTSYDYLPQSNYYFESRTYTDGHEISANTTLTYTYEPVPDSIGSYALISSLLLLVGLKRKTK
ncbi:hypothetical protein QEH56_11510 [Pelagicoccus enzymogenes]|uniref:hypothetical protein n=1 Tax=Pelagicoccus enzymogenes TaxID=2773457 RepID=UPI00280CC3A1|nr:hypothetical protein [Pelagicoccus enzymogenes]MDQ8198782.1 hypothetical protein [Pelagicoccus enzymogenes]